MNGKHKILAALTAAVVVGCGSYTTESKPSDDPAATPILSVCDISRLPEGWVVIAHNSSPACPGSGASVDYWDTYVISKAGDYETVCSDSPIPSGYVKVRPVRSIECVIPRFTAIDYTNAFEIEKL